MDDKTWHDIAGPLQSSRAVALATIERCAVELWPSWIEFLRWTCLQHASDQADRLVNSLIDERTALHPDPAAGPGMPARLRCAARIVAAACGKPLPRFGWSTDPAEALAERLLHDDVRNGWRDAPDLAGHAATGSACVQLKVLVERRVAGRARGQVLKLVLRRLPDHPHGCATPPLVRAPASFLVLTDPDFDTALQRVSLLLAREIAEPAVVSTLAYSWDLRPLAGTPLPNSVLSVGGGSAGAAFALAAMSLARQHLPAWRHRLQRLAWPRLAVTAELHEDLKTLQIVGGVAPKLQALKAWNDLQDATNWQQPTRVFVAEGQDASTDLPAITPVPCRTLDDLVTAAARHTGGELTADQLALHDLLLRDEPVDDRLLITRVANESSRDAKSIVGYLVQRWARWAVRRPAVLDDEGGELDLRFVRLQVTTAPEQRGSEAVEAPGQEHTITKDSLRDLMDELGQREVVPAWLLVADPGAGKSVVLQHFEMEDARRLLRLLDDGTEHPAGLCIWIDLDAARLQADPADWMPALWQSQYPHLPRLPELMRLYRPRFIIDALNETVAPEQRGQALRPLVHWLRQHAGELSAPLFSVRQLERVTVSAGDFVPREVRLLRWKDKAMQEYCRLRLGPGNALGAMLAQPDQSDLRELCSLPFNLAGQCVLMKPGRLGRPAADRVELMSALAWLALRREFMEKERPSAGLLHGDDWDALEGGLPSRREGLLALPARGELVRGLDLAAARMQAGALDKRHRDALDFGLSGEARDRWLAAALGLGVLEIDPNTKVVSFRHESWQEFFTARGWVNLPPADWPPCPAPALLPTPAHKDEPLPPPPVSPWEEVTKMAVQLSAQPADAVRRLMADNLALAGRAARLRLADLPADLLDELRQRLLARLRDPQTELTLRVEAGAALGEIGDPRWVDGRRDESDGKPFLVPGRWVRIEAATHEIGEKPVIRLPLPAFELAFSPVTNAEWRCFMLDDGYADARWWPGDAASAWLASNDHEPDYWHEPELNRPNQPVVGVCLHEARAYVLWLRARSGWDVALPSEGQWEASARQQAGARMNRRGEIIGAGGVPPVNCSESRLHRLAPVGAFPVGDLGDLVDMLGNSWEWTVSVHADHLQAEHVHSTRPLETVDFQEDVPRAVRSSSWYYTAAHARAAIRDRVRPGHRYHFLGFRLLRVLPHS